MRTIEEKRIVRIVKLMVTAVAAAGIGTTAALVLRHFQPPPKPVVIVDEMPDALMVYCFHGNDRLEESERIEKFTREMLDKNFADAEKQGKLIWKVLNYDDPVNSELVEQFKVVVPCIVLADYRRGGTGWMKNLQQKNWEMLDNQEVFSDFVREEMEKMLR